MEEFINSRRILVGRPEEKSPVGGPRSRWEDNIKMDLKSVSCSRSGPMTGLFIVRAVMNLLVPKKTNS